MPLLHVKIVITKPLNKCDYQIHTTVPTQINLVGFKVLTSEFVNLEIIRTISVLLMHYLLNYFPTMAQISPIRPVHELGGCVVQP